MSFAIAAGVLLFIALYATNNTGKYGKPKKWKRDPWKRPSRW